MSGFDAICVVDWSAAKPPRNPATARPKKDAIWACVARDGVAESAVFLPDRPSAELWLRNLIQQNSGRLMIAFDFPFGYPAGFAKNITGQDSTLALWDWLEQRIVEGPDGANRYEVAETINALFEQLGPFWGKSHKDRYPGVPFTKDLGQFPFAYKRAVEEATGGTFSCFQLAGAGSVGSQVLTGLPILSRLRAFPGVVAWPFEAWADAPVVLTECWPGLIEPAVKAAGDGIRDAHQVALLARALTRLSPQEMSTLMDVDAPEEGWILGAGYAELLTERAMPDLMPPPIKDDCFALPPGVDWTPVDEALERLRNRLHPVVDVQHRNSSDADGLILASNAFAVRANPPAANSAVDGYGFAGSDVGAGVQRLPLVDGRAAAGAPFAGDVPKGSAVRILTGAVLPNGVDTVVLDEDVTTDKTHVAFRGPIKPGANTRRAGEDVAGGAQVLTEGTRLGPAELALLAATGVTEVATYRRLRVGVLSTGDEIVEAGATPDPARTYDANRPMLLSLLSDWRMEAVDLGHASDDRVAVAAALDAANVDAILTSGGASAGDEDHIAALLEASGTRNDWRIALKPGRPLVLGLWSGTPVFGLPGNPVAALVCSMIFARPALGLLAGEGWREPQAFIVPAAFKKVKKPGRREYLRARLDQNGRAEVFASEGSGRISGLAWADGLVELADDGMTISPGDPVRYLPFSGFR